MRYLVHPQAIPTLYGSTVEVEVDNETVEADNGVVHVTTRRMQGGHRLARTGKRHFSDKRNGEGKEQEVITPRA